MLYNLKDGPIEAFEWDGVSFDRVANFIGDKLIRATNVLGPGMLVLECTCKTELPVKEITPRCVEHCEMHGPLSPDREPVPDPLTAEVRPLEVYKFRCPLRDYIVKSSEGIFFVMRRSEFLTLFKRVEND